MSRARSTNGFPTHTQLAEFISSILPIHPADVPFSYHTPRHRGYDPSKSRVNQVVLSITPTSGVYAKLVEIAEGDSKRPLCFLHRPFNLNNRVVPRGVLILASHKRFDERLTVGYNLPLATELQLELKDHICIQGYKDDPERLMGLVALLREKRLLKDVWKDMMEQFGTCELHAAGSGSETIIRAVAIMNAFNRESVLRVAEAAAKKAWTEDLGNCGGILYLTGQSRDSGLTAAKDFKMPAICVGHRACEEWGIRFLGRKLKAEYPDIDVVEILEPEDERPSSSNTGNQNT